MDSEPTTVQGLPVDVQVAVLYERVGNLAVEVKALKRALWAFVFSILTGGILFVASISAGWINPGPSVPNSVAAYIQEHYIPFDGK